MRLALCGFDDELHAGLEQELQKKTMEVFRRLKFVAKSGKGSKTSEIRSAIFVLPNRGVLFWAV